MSRALGAPGLGWVVRVMKRATAVPNRIPGGFSVESAVQMVTLNLWRLARS